MREKEQEHQQKLREGGKVEGRNVSRKMPMTKISEEVLEALNRHQNPTDQITGAHMYEYFIDQ